MKNIDNSGVHRYDWLVKYGSQGLQVGGAGERVAWGQLQLYHIEAGPPALRPWLQGGQYVILLFVFVSLT